MTLSISTKSAQSIVGTNNDGNRPKDDFYPTPTEVTRALLRVEPFVPPMTIWEPACGNGAMSKVLESTGLNVFSTDLNNHGYGQTGVDFIDTDHGLMKDFGFYNHGTAIVTNPPFNLAYEFIEHAIRDLQVQKLCLLMKLSALEGRKRATLLEETHLSRVWVFKNRIQLTRNGEEMRSGGMMAFAWFVWERDWDKKPEIGWICTKE